MTVETPVLQRSFERDVAAALDPLRRKQRDLQAFMASQLERLEHQAGEVERREAELIDQADELAKRRAALDEEWSHLDALVETAQANAREIVEEKARLSLLIEQQCVSGVQAEIRRLREALEQGQHEREALEEELSTAQRKLGELADTAVELNEVRSELDQERRRYAEERASWLTELRTLSRNLGGVRQADAGEPPPREPPNTHADSDRPARPADAPSDGVLNRFEAMKRDLAKHRPPKK